MRVPANRGLITISLACALAIVAAAALFFLVRRDHPAQARHLAFPGTPTVGAVTATPTPLGFQTDTDTATATTTPTSTPISADSPTSSATPNITPVTVTFTPSTTSTPTNTVTSTPFPSSTGTDTATGTQTGTASVTGTNTATGTPTATGSPTMTPTVSQTTIAGTAVSGTPTISTQQVAALPAPAAPAGVGAVTLYFAEGYTGQAKTNGKVTYTETLNLLNPNPDPVPITITYTVDGGGPVTISRVLAPRSAARELVNNDVGPNRMVSAMISATERIVASRTISRVNTAGQRLDGSTTLPASAPATSWDFAEGYTGVSFQEYLALFNPGGNPAAVTLRGAPQGHGGAGTVTVAVPAHSRITVNVHALALGASSGVLVRADQPIVAERVEYFGDGVGSSKAGSTVSLGMSRAAGQRALRVPFASSGGMAPVRGSRTLQPRGDQAYIALLNPSRRTVTVTADFTAADGHPLGVPLTVKVAAGTRQTIGANAAAGSRPEGPISAALSATGPIEAESAQYFTGSPNQGSAPGIIVPAASIPLTDALFSDLGPTLADGAAIRRTVYLYNPDPSSIQVTATFMGNSGPLAAGTSYTVPAGGITVVDVGRDAATLGPLGAEFRSADGFLALAVGMTADKRCALAELASSAY